MYIHLCIYACIFLNIMCSVCITLPIPCCQCQSFVTRQPNVLFFGKVTSLIPRYFQMPEDLCVCLGFYGLFPYSLACSVLVLLVSGLFLIIFSIEILHWLFDKLKNRFILPPLLPPFFSPSFPSSVPPPTLCTHVHVYLTICQM